MTARDWYCALYEALERLLPATRSDAQAVADVHDLDYCHAAGMPPETVARLIASGAFTN